MSQQAVEYCLGRLLTDESFREMARQSFPQACQQLGLELTVVELELLNLVDVHALAQLSSSLDPGLMRTGSFTH